MKRFWAAMGFLTVMPLPAAFRHTEEDLVRSVPFFPVVGLKPGFYEQDGSTDFDRWISKR
jgi:cobalamin synthase